MKASHGARESASGGRTKGSPPKRNAVISLRGGRPEEYKAPLRRLARVGPTNPDGPGAVRNSPPKAPNKRRTDAGGWVEIAPEVPGRPNRSKASKTSKRSNAPKSKRKSTAPKATKVPRAPRKQPIVLSTPRNALPGWHDLASGETERHRMRTRHVSFLETISTTRFGLLILAVALVFTAYVGHVHATQDLLLDLQRAKKENLRLHLRHNRLKGVFDQATGPAVIYGRAKELGLEEGITYGPTIELNVR